MENMTIDQFIWAYAPCDAGEAFARKHDTIHDCYEALLRWEAGLVSFEWALWVLSEVRGDIEELMYWFIVEVHPMLPESLRDMVRPYSFYEDDSNDPESKLFQALSEYRRTKIPEYYTSECTFEHKKQLYAIMTCQAALTGNLHSAGSSCFSACLLEEEGADGEALCDLETELLRQSIGQPTTSLLKYQEQFLARLREFGNPFEKEFEE